MKNETLHGLSLTDAAREKIARFMADDPRKIGKGGLSVVPVVMMKKKSPVDKTGTTG